MLLEEAPETTVEGVDPRPHHVITTSARALVSLKSNKRRLLEFLALNPGAIKLADLAYTTTSRRIHHGFRTAYSVSNTAELIKLITKDMAESKEPSRTVNPPSVVFLFTGQGSHYAGMGKALFDTSLSFRNNIIEYNDIGVAQGQLSFLPWILDEKSDINGMTPTQLQLGLVALELALANLWQSWGLKPDVVIGHSLGEYPALCVAGVLSVADMFYLVINRAEILQKKCTAYTHSMLAIGASAERLASSFTSDLASCEVACVNSPESTVISGSAEDIKNLKDRLDQDGIKSTLLKVPFAFHSSQMDPILSEFEAVAQKAHFAKPTVPVASSLTGSLVSTEGVFSANYLASQTRNKVNFLGALKACRSSGITDEKTLWIENGPSPVCLGMVRATNQLPPANALPSMRPNEDVWKTISNGIANAYNSGSDVSWYNYHREYETALRLIRLPTYAFDLKNYWIQNEGRFNNAKNSDHVSGKIAAPAFSTTCLQRVESETFDQKGASVTFVSNAAEENLFAAIQGHLVDGVGLCPSSVYSDMAFTAASYIHSKVKPTVPVPAMDVANMEVFHPLVVVSNKSQQIIKVAASLSPGSDTTEIRFSSQEGTESTDHGKCIVRYGDGNEWKTEWSRTAYLVQSRIDALVESAKVGLTHRILRPMVYKLFSALVVYDKKYQGLTDVFMDSTLHEASANINFDKTTTSASTTGTFTYSPYWIDSIVHLAGFVLNGHFTTPEDKVFISHGWKSLRIAVGKLDEGKSYNSYVRMQPVPGTRGVMAGDVYLFDGEEVVAMCTGLKFQELKKTILHSLLAGSSNSISSSGQKTTTVTTTSQTRVPNHLPQEKVPRGAKPSKAVGPTAVTKIRTDSLPRGSLFSKVLDIIAAEVKLDKDEFTDEAEFAELGIDSLLTISIMSLLQAQLALTLPTSIFTNYPTVGTLRTFIQQEYATTETDAESDSTNSGLSSSENNNDNLSTPRSELSPIDSPDVAEVFMSAVAAETGINPSEIEPSTLFSELGVESLMSIAVLSTVKDRTGVMLPTSFLIDNPTVAEVRKALRNNDQAPPQSCPRPGALKRALEKEVNVVNSSSGSAKKYSSKTVFIQGRLSSRLTPLIFIADGAGSAASYINLPSFPSGRPVYALESPFLHSPLEYNISFEAVASIYVCIHLLPPHPPRRDQC